MAEPTQKEPGPFEHGGSGSPTGIDEDPAGGSPTHVGAHQSAAQGGGGSHVSSGLPVRSSLPLGGGLPVGGGGLSVGSGGSGGSGGPARPGHQPPQGGGGSQAPEERRGVLKALVTIGGIAYAGAIAVPAWRFATSPAAGSGDASGGRERWIRVGRLDALPPGEPRRLQLTGDERDAFTVTKDQLLGSVWLVREGDKVRAMSATCPHLGCAIDLNADKKSFACPCHASRFALTGATEAGPSPRAMDPLATRVVDGWIEVDFRRFRQGSVEREEV